jgi:hypothetical protein
MPLRASRDKVLNCSFKKLRAIRNLRQFFSSPAVHLFFIGRSKGNVTELVHIVEMPGAWMQPIDLICNRLTVVDVGRGHSSRDCHIATGLGAIWNDGNGCQVVSGFPLSRR